MKTTLISSFAILMCSGLLTGAEEHDASRTARNFEIDSRLATWAHWSIQEGRGILQITLPVIRDGVPMPKPPSTQIWLLKHDGSSTGPSTKGDRPIGVSMAGTTTPHLMYEFPPRETSTAVAVVVQLEREFFVFSLIPENDSAEPASSGQPATAPESKPEGSDKPQPESEGRSR